MTSEVDFFFKMLDIIVDADFNTLEMWFSSFLELSARFRRVEAVLILF